jgi:hypothetical protein
MLEMDILITPKSKAYLLCYAVRYEVLEKTWGHEQIKLYAVWVQNVNWLWQYMMDWQSSKLTTHGIKGLNVKTKN